MNTRDDNFYESSDLNLAAALLSYNAMLVRVNKENPKRAVFVFTNSVELPSLVDMFWTGELTVSALNYSENIKRLKNRIYGE